MVLDRAVRKLREAIEHRQAPTPELLHELVYGWGNESWSAASDYLEECMNAVSACRGPILECGSGLSTIAMGLVAARDGKRIYTLEHTPEWAGKVGRELKRYEIASVTMISRPLRDHGAFDWYDVSPALVGAEGIDLIICDGPPAKTRGGRMGVIPVMKGSFADNALILLDDTARPGEQAVIEQWKETERLTIEEVQVEKPYSRISWRRS